MLQKKNILIQCAERSRNSRNKVYILNFYCMFILYQKMLDIPVKCFYIHIMYMQYNYSKKRSKRDIIYNNNI